MAKTADYRLGAFTYPRGWFVVALSDQLSSTPINERYFGEDVILYRGASGRVVMLDAYCPHMGTHMGKNKTSHSVVQGRHVEGDCIRCPYHGWRFAPDGQCTDIPFHEGRIPAAAKVRSWQVEERYGLIFCWHDPEGAAPDFALPEYPEWNDPQWVRWTVDSLGTLPTHPQEVVDNASDLRHLTFLHGAKVSWYENEVDGHILHQRQGATGVAASKDAAALQDFHTQVRYIGPALLTSRFYMGDSKVPFAAQLIAHTPVEDGITRLWQASMMRSSQPVATEEDQQKARGLNQVLKHGFMEDFEIWENKRPAVNILQMPSDGPFRMSRLWYSQFYQPRAKTAEILARAQGLHRSRGCPTAAEFAAQQATEAVSAT